MAKGKTANPADAFRKAQRKKELKKNKAERQKTRDFALVKKDTSELEEEIARLEADPNSDKQRLNEAKNELEKINKKKEEYVAEHPEQRKLVYRPKRTQQNQEESRPAKKSRNLFDKNGLPRHPERSIYYEPVMNPFGVAPPGMPYMERPLLPGEKDSDVEDMSDEDKDDDDIPMPEQPPPLPEETGEDSDDDIPMPEGPPPGSFSADPPPLPSGPPPIPMVLSLPQLPFSPPGSLTLPPPPPTAPFGAILPPPPPAGPPAPGPPYGVPMQKIPLPPGIPLFPPQNYVSMPPPPPGFFPRRNQSEGVIQDPLSAVPHQTYQAYRAGQLQGHPSLPPKPAASTVTSPATTVSASATVSAEPELRDFKKEATAFVPTTLKRKAKEKAASSAGKINAAPSLAPTGTDMDVAAPRPDLLSTLKDHLPVPATVQGQSTAGASKPSVAKGKDDYEKFVEEMGDLLGG